MLYSHLPQKPGVYLFKDKKGKVLYVGKAGNLKKRVASYFTPPFDWKKKGLLRETEKVDYFLTDSEIEALLLEARLIKKHQPKYNERLKDDKRFPSIGVTIREKYPRVFYTRKKGETRENPEVLFFGPFPNPAVVKRVLRLLRKIFPFRSCKRMPKKPCLYFHLHLCPGVCLQKGKNYKKTIQQLVMFLRGEKTSLLRELKGEMEKAADEERFAEAARLKRQLADLEYITSSCFIAPFFPRREREKEIWELRKILGLARAKRIEGFDVSSIGGKKAVGSLVVFLNGEPEKGGYRRFRIKTEKKLGDVGMLKEVVRRRLNHPEWRYPDLMVIDGGKGQVGGVLAVLQEKGLQIPVVGLVKREEKIIRPTPLGRFEEITLPDDSPALHLLQRIRDEAHRFAIAYHKKLRIKSFLP